MRFAFILLGLFGLAIFIWSAIALIKAKKSKRIVLFPLNSEKKILTFDETGLYSISFLGAGYIKNINATLTSSELDNKVPVKLNRLFPSYRYKLNGELGLEYWNFTIEHAGSYNLRFQNLERLIARSSVLRYKIPFQKQIEADSLKILVKKAIPPVYRVISIIGLVLGANAMAWGVLIGLFDVFN